MSFRTNASRAIWPLAAAGVALQALQGAFHVFGATGDRLIGDGLYNVLLIAAAALVFVRARQMGAEARAWRMLGAALGVWAAGFVVYIFAYDGGATAPYPSAADVLWIASYPLTIAALAMLVRARTSGLSHAGIWIDAGLGACAVTALAAAAAFGPVLRVTHGSALTVATNMAYPVGDLLLFAMVMAMFALTGWRPGRGLAIIAAALLLRAGTDSILLYQVSKGDYTSGGLLDAAWPLISLLVAAAAWQGTERRIAAAGGWKLSLIPAAFTLSALALLVIDHFTRLSILVVALSSATIAFAALRMLMMLRESRQAHERSAEQAVTDPLTGLANRRALMRDLEAALEQRGPAAECMLALFDLDGFKHYNDTFGHPAGDALLARLGRRLREAMEPYGGAYRIGGDEFCVLIAPRAAGPEMPLAAAAEALSEVGAGFVIANSYGTASLPAEAMDVTAALHVADTRMYRQKNGHARTGSVATTCDALIRAQRERLPTLDAHVQDVTALAGAIGRRLGMDAEHLDELARAAQLHDIGKVAIPDALLDKPAPLTDDEVTFMRRHTVIGQRIVGTAPALEGIGRLIRASHEQFDGSGYPDRLAGDEIPLGSRIVSVCDAYEAMVSNRPYRAPLSSAEAIAELHRCAGSQFDPRVVDEFCAEIDRHVVAAPAGHAQS